MEEEDKHHEEKHEVDVLEEVEQMLRIVVERHREHLDHAKFDHAWAEGDESKNGKFAERYLGIFVIIGSTLCSSWCLAISKKIVTLIRTKHIKGDAGRAPGRPVGVELAVRRWQATAKQCVAPGERAVVILAVTGTSMHMPMLVSHLREPSSATARG